MTPLLDIAQQWAAADCDPSDRASVEQLVAASDEEALRERFAGNLAFGTAGLRAIVGAGSSRMNRAVVRRTTRAVAEYLLAKHPDARTQPVVVGYDGRLSSQSFARETVGAFVAAGIPVRYFEEPVATPVVAFALRRYKAIAAVVVTASHNPPEYNGYKLYAANGAQIISPADVEIAAIIDGLGPAKEIPVVLEALDGGSELAEPVATSVVDAYFREIDGLRARIPHVETSSARGIGIVYTAMHGVGYKPVKRALETAGFTQVIPVTEQTEPDGNFPTVRFPNPEEPGALDMALAKAEAHNADVILANDPDVDRLAVCVRMPLQAPDAHKFRTLTGNQVGILLADCLLEGYKGDAKPLVVQSIVSSPMLRAVALDHGARFEQTLTGFKWVWNAALELREQDNLHFVFGFEEALGYSAEDIVRDKDGVGAALLFAELVASERGRGSTVADRLAALYRKHGLWVSLQHSVVLPGSEGVAKIANAIENLAKDPPNHIGGFSVSDCIDFRTGGENRPAWLENSKLLEFRLGDRGRVLVRPSGTEPKLKFYVDLCLPVAKDANVWVAEAPALAQAKAAASELLERSGLAQ